MGYGFFTVKFFKADGTPDPETAKKALDWAGENLDWVKELKPFSLGSSGNWTNNEDDWTDGVDIDGSGVPDEIGGWVKAVGDASGAAAIAAWEVQDFQESDMDNIGTVAAVYKDGNVEESGYLQGEEAYEEAERWTAQRIKASEGAGEEEEMQGDFVDNYGNWAEHDSARYNVVGCPGRNFALLPVRAMIEDSEELWDSLAENDIYKDELPELPGITMYDEEFADYEVDDGEEWLQFGYGDGDLLDAGGNRICSLKDVDHVDNSDGETLFWRVPFADLDAAERKAGNFVLTPEARRSWAEKLGITLDGSGKADSATKDFEIAGGVLNKYTGSDANVVIPDGVTEIGEDAFAHCTSLASVTIPEGVTEIGEGAFPGCKSLKSVAIPGSVTTIGEHAFSGCTSLASVSIPDSVTEIGKWAFYTCTSLAEIHYAGSKEQWEAVEKGGNWRRYTPAESVQCADGSVEFPQFDIKDGTLKVYFGTAASVSIPDGVTAIGEKAFYGCEQLASVTIPGSVTEIGEMAFEGCPSLASVTISEGVTKIGKRAFTNCKSLASVSIPGSVTEIGESAFFRCTSLASISIPDGVTAIGEEAFKECTSLTSVSIPGSVTKIGEKAFSCCKSLKSVVIPEGVTKIGKWAFYACTSLASISIPDGVTAIGEEAFKECTSLASVVISEGVTEIGEVAFFGCTSLASVSIPDSVTVIGEDAFKSCNIIELSHPCLKIRAGLVIQDDVLRYCACQMESVNIPDGVTEICEGAFQSCTALASVTIPASVTKISDWAFEGCTSLAEIHYAGSKEQWYAVKKGRNWNEDVPAKDVLVRKD